MTRTGEFDLEEGEQVIGRSEIKLNDRFNHVGRCDALPRPSYSLIMRTTPHSA